MTLALRGLALGLAIGLALAGCGANTDTAGRSEGRGSAPASTGAVPETAAPSPIPRPSEPGPFEGLTWSGEPVPTGALLHDDGTRLWSIRPNGERGVIWRHPPADVTQLAASPGGEQLAMSVALGPRHAIDPSLSLIHI